MRRFQHQVNRAHHLFGLIATILFVGGCGVGHTELLVILGVVVLMFGANRLPQLGRALGEMISGFRESTTKSQLAEKKEPPALADTTKPTQTDQNKSS